MDSGQDIVEIMGEPSRELADRLHLLRLAEELLDPRSVRRFSLKCLKCVTQFRSALDYPAFQ
jgi:hypothetical protein